MMTVNEVSKLTGVSIRALQYYDRIGLLSPSQRTEAGYRLYDDTALERLQQILLFRELEFPLGDIRAILEAPDFDRDKALGQQIELLELRIQRLEALVGLAREIREKGEMTMDFKAFDSTQIEEFAARAKAEWGDTKAFAEYEQKSGARSAEEERTLANELMSVFAEFGATGAWIGLAFFTLVLFAAFTSAISMTEACVAAICDFLHVKRNTSVAAVCAWCVAVGSLSAFGYGRWSAFKPFGLPALDFFDSSMNVLTPIVAALICVFAGWVLRPKRVLAECRRDGSAVGFKTFYAVMVKFIAPLLVLAILVSEICRTLNIGGWKI